MKWILLFVCLVFVSCVPTQTPGEVIGSRLVNRSGEVMRDERDVLGSFGIRMGCNGSVFSANVRIEKADININGDIATVKATYSGMYKREGWKYPCVEIETEENGIKVKAEKNDVFGVITFVLKQIYPESMTLIWGEVTEFGTVIDKNKGTIDKDISRDSNKLAIEAAKCALRSAFVLR